MSSVSWGTGMLVLSIRVLSAERCSSSTLSASSTGTWVNRVVRSKLTRRSSASSSMLLTLSTNAEEFFAECGVSLARG